MPDIPNTPKPPVRLVLIRDHKWSDDFSYLRQVTCINHQTARYLTKNPWQRGLHLIHRPEDTGQDKPIERTDTGECKCSFSDLAVWIDEDGNDKCLYACHMIDINE